MSQGREAILGHWWSHTHTHTHAVSGNTELILFSSLVLHLADFSFLPSQKVDVLSPEVMVNSGGKDLTSSSFILSSIAHHSVIQGKSFAPI